MSFASLVQTMDRALQLRLGGVVFTYETRDGQIFTDIPGMFDEVYELQRPEQSSVEVVGPVLWARLEDLPVHPDDDDPTIYAITPADGVVTETSVAANRYRIRERQTDGPMGETIRLLLHRDDEG